MNRTWILKSLTCRLKSCSTINWLYDFSQVFHSL
jgi:hypothetical protein